MAGKKKNRRVGVVAAVETSDTARAEASGEYVSRSTIDYAPREPKEAKEPKETQQTFWPEEKANEKMRELTQDAHRRKFKVDLSLKLQPQGDKSYTIPLLIGEIPSDYVIDLVLKAVESRRNKAIIEAILDNPDDDSKKETPPTSNAKAATQPDPGTTSEKPSDAPAAPSDDGKRDEAVAEFPGSADTTVADACGTAMLEQEEIRHVDTVDHDSMVNGSLEEAADRVF